MGGKENFPPPVPVHGGTAETPLVFLSKTCKTTNMDDICSFICSFHSV